MEKEKNMQDTHLQLCKSSQPEQVKNYFTALVALKHQGEDFPVDLDDVWPLAYTTKGNAVRELKNDEMFVQSFDYQVFIKNEENPKGGRPTENYKLSLSCLEYLIVKKRREFFEVYRQVFHQAVEGTLAFGQKQYISIHDYCQRYGKSVHSFWGLLAHYKMEFLFANGHWSISTDLCAKAELENRLGKKKAVLRERNDPKQLQIPFN